MAIITLPNQLTDGTVADAAQVMADLNTIVNDYNGNINNSNLSSSIAITDSKLNQITTAGKVSGTALTSLASIPSGAGVIPAANLTYINIQYPYVNCSNNQTQGTGGGAGTTGNWETMPLNTLNTDTQSISSLGSNQLTLPAGTYKVWGIGIFCQTNTSQIRLYNATTSTILLNGTDANAVASVSGANHPSFIIGYITLSITSSIEIQYQIETHTGNSDLGNPSDFGTEVYNIVEFTKVQ
jgi:hypothetical protein